MPSDERPQITNEEAVLLWLAYEQARRMERGTLPASGPVPLRPREFTMHQVEDACWQYWRIRGGKASRSTMIRAAWRVLGPADRFGNRDGSDPGHLLGAVEALKREGSRFYVFRYSAGASELIARAGLRWQSIPHKGAAAGASE